MDRKVIQIEIKPPVEKANPNSLYSLNRERREWVKIIKYSELYRFCKNTGDPRLFNRIIKIKIHCTRFSSKEMDYDNLVQSFRPMLNAMVNLDILKDDSPKYINISYSSGYAEKNEKSALIHLEIFEFETLAKESKMNTKNWNEALSRMQELEEIVKSASKELEEIKAGAKEKGSFMTKDFVVSVDEVFRQQMIGVAEASKIIARPELERLGFIKIVSYKTVKVSKKAVKEGVA